MGFTLISPINIAWALESAITVYQNYCSFLDMASNAMFEYDISSTCEEEETHVIHGPLLGLISMNFSIITKEEETCFKRLKQLLQDTSCHFTNDLLPIILQSTVDAFPQFGDETCPLFQLMQQLLNNLEAELEDDEEDIHNINLRVVPRRFFRMINDFMPLFVRDTLWDQNAIDLLDDVGSTIVWSIPSTPEDGVTEGPAWEEEIWGPQDMSPQF